MFSSVISNYRRLVDKSLSDLRVAEESHRQEQKTFVDEENKQDDILEAQRVLQAVAQTVQQEAHDRIASVVSTCLRSVFTDPYEFKIAFERKRGKTEATILFQRGNLILDDPKRQVGGGVIDVASLALRLAALVLQKPPLRRVLILDEPFSKIRGKENRERVRTLMVELARDFGVQIIASIDLEAYPEFALGKVIELG